MIDPLYVLRDVEVPVGARARVRARIEDHLDRAVLPKRRGLAFALTASAAVVAVVAVVVWLVALRETTPREVAVPAVQPPAENLVVDEIASQAAPVVAQDEPHVREPALDVMVDGAARIILNTMQLTIRVVAGSAYVEKPVITSETIELTPAPKPAPAVQQPAPPPVEEIVAPAAEPVEPAPLPDKLAEAVREYRAATALEGSDPTAAVTAWQGWRSRWSQTALAHGAELRLLALLGKLDRRQEAASLAREFLQRYPRSPRRADVERVLEGSR